MSDSETRQYFNPVPPQQSTTPGVGITRLATSTSAVAYDLDAGADARGNPNMFGTRLTLTNEGSAATDFMWIVFSATNITPVSGATAAGASVVAGTVAGNGLKLLPGQSIVVRLDRVAQRYLQVQAAANTPILCVYPSSEPRLS